MTATARRPSFRPSARPGPLEGPTPGQKTVRNIIVGVAALIAALVLAKLSASIVTAAALVALLLAVVAGLFLRNEPQTLLPLAIYVMWFEAVGVGPIKTGRIVAALTIGIIAARSLTTRWRPPMVQPRVWVPVLAFTAWAWVSGLWSAEFGTWLQGFLFFFLGVCYFLLFAIFVESPEQVLKLLEVWVLIGVIIAGLSALVHYGFGYRSFGFTGGPNEYATYNVQALPICVVLARRSTGWKKAFFLLAMPAFFFGTLAAGSRSGLIGTAVMAMYCFVARPGLSAAKRAAWTVGGLFLAVGGFLLAGILDAERFSLVAFVSDRGAGRLDIWTGGLVAFREHALLGFGAGGFEKKAIDYIVKATGASLDVTKQEQFRNENKIPAHNLYLAVLLDYGLVGLMLYFTMIATVLKNLWDMRKSIWGDLAWIGIGITLMLLVANVFGATLNNKMQWSLIGLTGAYFVRYAITDREARRSRFVSIGAGDGTG